MNKIYFLIATLLIFCTANASDRSGTNVLSLKNIDSVESLYSNSIVAADAGSGNISKLNSPIEFKFRVNGVGRFKASFNRQKFFKFQDKNQVLLQGETEILSGTSGLKKVSSASLIRNGDGGYFVNIMTLSNSRRKNGWQGVMTVNLEIANEDEKFVVKNKSVDKSRRSAGKFGCINNQHSHSSADLSGVPSTKAIVKIVTVLLEADAEYAAVLSSETLQRGETRGTVSTTSAMIMNQTDAVYQSDLGVSLVTTLPTAATNYSTAIGLDSNYEVYLHAEMAAVHPASSRVEDVHYLLSGKEPDSTLPNLAGIARDIGAVCKNPDNAVALTIRISNNEDYLTTAHEIGHLFGGEHDDDFTSASNPGIMNAGTQPITGDITNFSTYSKNQIGTYVQENSSCMTEGEGTGGGGGEVPSTLPAGSVFDAYREGRYLIAEIYDEVNETGHAGIPVSVLYKKSSRDAFAIIKTITTDEDGYAEYKVSKKKLGTYALEAGGTRSRSVKIKK